MGVGGGIHTHTHTHRCSCMYKHTWVYTHTYIQECNTKSRYLFSDNQKPQNILMKAKICCFWNSLSFTLAQQTCNLSGNYMQEEVPTAKLSAISSSSATDDSAFCFDYSRRQITCWTAPSAFYYKYAAKHQWASKQSAHPSSQTHSVSITRHCPQFEHQSLQCKIPRFEMRSAGSCAVYTHKASASSGRAGIHCLSVEI